MKTHHLWRESIPERIHFMRAQLNVQAAPTSVPAPRHAHLHPLRSIRFYCAAPRARSVEIMGDLTDWQPLVMSPSPDGWWQIQLELRPGHHHYRFLVDGQPMLDPHAPGSIYIDHNECFSLLAVK